MGIQDILCETATRWKTLLQLFGCILFIFSAQNIKTGESLVESSGRLPAPPTYVIIAPSRIRPNQVVNIYISLFKLRYPLLNIRTAIRRDQEEVISATEQFRAESTRLTQLRIPETAEDGNYTLLVEGSVDEKMAMAVFRNETKLSFSAKRVSVFIFTDQRTYQKKSEIFYRVVALNPDLTLVKSGSVEVWVKDGKGQIVRRWLNLQVNHGYHEGRIPFGHPVKTGWFTIEVHGWGCVYSKTFESINYFFTRHEQLVTVPQSVVQNEYAVGGIVKTYFTHNWMPVKGNATVTLELHHPDLGEGEDPPTIQKTYPMIQDEFAFNFPLEDIQRAIAGNIENTDVYIHADVYDWFGMESVSYHGYTKIIPSGYHLKFLGGKIRAFKPGNPLTAYIAAYSNEGKPQLSSFNRMVKIQTIARRLNGNTVTMETSHLLGEDSMVHYSYQTHHQDEFIKVRASFVQSESSYHEMTAYRHYTESGHYLSVTTSTKVAAVDTYIVFTVRCTTFVDVIHYVVASGGNIIMGNQLFMSSNQKTFSLAPSRDMVPNARIVVWGMLNDGEILADSLSFHVQGIRNEMVVRVNRGKDFSGDTVEVNAFTDPSSYTAYAVEQEELYLQGVNPFFNTFIVEEELSSYDDHVNNSFKHTWWNDKNYQTNVFFPAPSYAIDANDTFKFNGLLLFTDANLTRLPAAHHCNISLGYLPCWDGSCFHIDQQCDTVRQCEDGADELGCPDPSVVETRPPDIYNETERLWRHLQDDRMWGWKTIYNMPQGRIDFKIDVPILPRKWVLNGFSLDIEKGLSFQENPVTLDTTRLFFIIVEVPGEAVRGEQLGVQISVFNTWDQYMEVILMLTASDEYRFVVVEDFGIVSSYEPRTTTGDIQTMVPLFAGTSKFIHFPVLPIKIGTISITVKAYSFTNSYSVTKNVKIVYDGVTNYWHTPYLIDLVSTGSKLTPYLWIPVPERFIDPGERQHLYVPGSGKCTVSLVGDVVGTGLFSSTLDVQKMFDMVYGNGEHYVFNFAANFYWLKFLKITNYLSKKQLDAGLEGLNVDLAEVVSYIQDDGGCALRRTRPPSSTWFTAVTLEHLSAGFEPEWQAELYVDVPILNKLAIFLAEHQDQYTGAFWDMCIQYDIKMRGNLTDDDGKPANISLTAFGTLALAKAKDSLSGKAQVMAVNAVNLGTEYLVKWFSKLTNPYEICLVAYVLEIASHTYRATAFQKVQSIKRTENFVYWSPEKIEPNPVDFVDGIPYQKPRETPPPYHTTAVQATSYALIIYLRNNMLKDAEPIMNWLQTQRDHMAGFGATQDSIVALMALIAYGERETNRHLHNIRLNAQAVSTPGWNFDVHLNSTNYMTEATGSVPKVWGAVTSNVQGTGIALYQMRTSVNVEYPHQIRQPQIRAFDLEIDQLLFKGRNSSLFEMNICIRWVATHISPISGAAILEVDIPTGFFVRKQELRKWQRVGRIDSQRSRWTKNKVVMYFDYLDNNRSCFYFPGERWYPVANVSIQNKIRIYDTYEPAFFNVTLYNTYTLFHHHMCQVCGSFQCPFCPGYNTAGQQYPMTYHILLINISLFTISKLLTSFVNV